MSVFATPASRLVSHRQSGLQDYIAISRYARYSPSKRRRETWSEAVARVRDMHLTHYRDTSLKDIATEMIAKGEISAETVARAGELGSLHGGIFSAFAGVDAKEVLPSSGSLQFGGG